MARVSSFKVLRAEHGCGLCELTTAAVVWIPNFHDGEVTGGDWTSLCAGHAIDALDKSGRENLADNWRGEDQG
jgi:hypothetical protein